MSELLRLSAHRQAVLAEALDDRIDGPSLVAIDPYDEMETGGPSPRNAARLMGTQVERIRLLHDGLGELAATLAQAHHDAERAGGFADANDVVGAIDAAMLPSSELQRMHREILMSFRQTTGLNSAASRQSVWPAP